MQPSLEKLFTVANTQLNPVYKVIVATEVLEVTGVNGLERTYRLRKSNKVLNLLRDGQAVTDHLCRLDHNVVLDLYPETYEYVFGPFVDANADEFALVYLLYTNRINQENYLKVVYANRFLLETSSGVIQPFSDALKDNVAYMETMASMPVLTGKLSLNCYYTPYALSEQERSELRKIYNASWVGNASYNTLRENYNVGITLVGSSTNGGANLIRVLYELHHEKAKLDKDWVVYSINGRKADVRLSNLGKRNVNQVDLDKREEAMRLYGLDVGKLEQLFSEALGFNRFRGIYVYEGTKVDNSLKNRKYIKLVKDGTDQQYTILLSRALMCVQENRVLGVNEEVDHINRDHCDDRVENLRIVAKTINNAYDAVRSEFAPVVCCVCGKHHSVDGKKYSYLQSSPNSPIVCSDKCRETWNGYSLDKRAETVKNRKLNHWYYVWSKDTGGRLYFPTKDYAEARAMMLKDGDRNLSKVRPA